MKFVIFGVGAIGTYLGVSLIQSGQAVTFVERPEILREAQDRPIRLEAGEQVYTVDSPQIVPSVDEALAGDPQPFAIVAVKSFDTRSVGESLARHRTELAGVISFQNGVENEQVLAEYLGAERVIPGTLTSAIGRRGPGDVTLERLRGIGLAGNHPAISQLLAAMAGADLNPAWFGEPAAMKWSKMLTNLLVNASSAILDLTPEQILDDPRLYRLEVRQIRETLAVMEAYGYPVVDLPGTPIRALTTILKRLPPVLSRLVLRSSIIKGRGGKMPSFHIDLSQGHKQLEVGYLNGAVVRAGAKKGIPTPVNQALNEALSDIAAGKYKWQEFKHNPVRLLQMF